LLQGDVAALKRDYEQRLDNLTAQLLESEDVLGNKDSQIQALQQNVKDNDVLKRQLAQQKDEIEALQAQVTEPMMSLSRLYVQWHTEEEIRGVRTPPIGI